MTPFRGVIFDVDGTLVDSNDAHAHAWVDALSRHGYIVSFERIRKLIGMGGDKLLPKVIYIEKETEEGRAISEQRSTIFKEHYFATVTGFPHARALVERLRDDGFKLVVASSATEEELEPLLQRAGVEDLLTKRTSSDDAENSKPDPDIVCVALQQLDLPADAVVMIGDTPYDIQAAHKAGIAIIALRCGGWGDEDLAGALAIFDDPADLLANYATSPFFDAATA